MNSFNLFVALMDLLWTFFPDRRRAHLRRPLRRIGELLDRFTPDTGANYFAVAGYGDSF